MHFGKSYAFVVVTVGAVFDFSLLSTFSYFTYVAVVEDAFSGAQAAIAVDVFGFEWMTILFCPQFCYSLSFNIVI